MSVLILDMREDRSLLRMEVLRGLKQLQPVVDADAEEQASYGRDAEYDLKE